VGRHTQGHGTGCADLSALGAGRVRSASPSLALTESAIGGHSATLPPAAAYYELMPIHATPGFSGRRASDPVVDDSRSRLKSYLGNSERAPGALVGIGASSGPFRVRVQRRPSRVDPSASGTRGVTCPTTGRAGWTPLDILVATKPLRCVAMRTTTNGSGNASMDAGGPAASGSVEASAQGTGPRMAPASLSVAQAGAGGTVGVGPTIVGGEAAGRASLGTGTTTQLVSSGSTTAAQAGSTTAAASDSASPSLASGAASTNAAATGGAVGLLVKATVGVGLVAAALAAAVYAGVPGVAGALSSFASATGISGLVNSVRAGLDGGGSGGFHLQL
jgi:hypothetical protein